MRYLVRAITAALWTALLLTAPLYAAPLSEAAPLSLYVSPLGKDSWTGSLSAPDKAGLDGPLCTLTRARDELRRLKAAGKLPRGATVNLRGGVYRLSEPLRLGPEDSGTPAAPILWRAYRNEKVTLTGALPLSGFAPWKGQIQVADLRGTPLEKVAFRQLFFAGRRQVMARYPNLDPDDPHGGQWAYLLDAEPAPATNRSVSDNIPQVKDRFTATSDVIKPTWEKVTRAEVAIHPAYGWAWNIVPIKSVDDDADLITLATPVSYGLMVGDRYFVQNLLAELDAPGEWYLDRDEAKLYFWPPADLRTGEVSVPVSESLLVAEGVADVELRGLTLEACSGDAVTLKDCERAMVRGTTIRNTGLWAVAIVGGHGTGATGNDIYATGAGGVSINSGDRKTLARGDCYADNNYVHHIAAFQRTYNTGVNLFGVGNRASHNLIHDCYHQAILMGGNDNVAEYNIVHHTNLGSEDTGGLYMSSRDYTQRGNIIRYNLFHHIGASARATPGRRCATARWSTTTPASPGVSTSTPPNQAARSSATCSTAFRCAACSTTRAATIPGRTTSSLMPRPFRSAAATTRTWTCSPTPTSRPCGRRGATTPTCAGTRSWLATLLTPPATTPARPAGSSATSSTTPPRAGR